MRSPPNRRYVPRAGRRNLLKTLFVGLTTAIFALQKRTEAATLIDDRFRCCANCRFYVPPNNLMMLDGPPSGYCSHPKRVGARYIYDGASVEGAGLYQQPGNGCDELFEGNVRDQRST